jgi:hypothetical protein
MSIDFDSIDPIFPRTEGFSDDQRSIIAERLNIPSIVTEDEDFAFTLRDAIKVRDGEITVEETANPFPNATIINADQTIEHHSIGPGKWVMVIINRRRRGMDIVFADINDATSNNIRLREKYDEGKNSFSTKEEYFEHLKEQIAYYRKMVEELLQTVQGKIEMHDPQLRNRMKQRYPMFHPFFDAVIKFIAQIYRPLRHMASEVWTGNFTGAISSTFPRYTLRGMYEHDLQMSSEEIEVNSRFAQLFEVLRKYCEQFLKDETVSEDSGQCFADTKIIRDTHQALERAMKQYVDVRFQDFQQSYPDAEMPTQE